LWAEDEEKGRRNTMDSDPKEIRNIGKGKRGCPKEDGKSGKKKKKKEKKKKKRPLVSFALERSETRLSCLFLV